MNDPLKEHSFPIAQCTEAIPKACSETLQHFPGKHSFRKSFLIKKRYKLYFEYFYRNLGKSQSSDPIKQM